jgi:hypothetical protein
MCSICQYDWSLRDIGMMERIVEILQNIMLHVVFSRWKQFQLLIITHITVQFTGITIVGVADRRSASRIPE